MSVLPNLIGAVVLLIVGWIVAKLVSMALKKILETIQFDKFTTKIVQKSSLDLDFFKINPSSVISKFVYWMILLLFFISASDTLGMNVVSESIGSLINYLPQLFSAIILFVIGLYIAGFVRNFIRTAFESLKLSAGKLLSEIAFYIILVIIGTAGLNQAGIDTTILTANISIIFGGLLLAFAIGFGLSSREILANILSSFYVKNKFSAGDKVKIDGIEGEIKEIDSVHTVIKTSNGEWVVPTQRFVNESVNKLS